MKYHPGQVWIVPSRMADPHQAHRSPTVYTAGRARSEALTTWRTTGKAPEGMRIWCVPAAGAPLADPSPDVVAWPAADARPKTAAPADARPKGLYDQ